MSTGFFRVCSLAAALAALCGTGHASAAELASAKPSGRLNASMLQGGQADGHDRFIVSYRDGAVESASPGSVVQNITLGLSRARLAGGIGAAGTIHASYVRRLATGAHVVHTSRKLDTHESLLFMRQLAADPAVAHVEPDIVMHAIGDVRRAATPATFVPDDPYYARYQWHLRAGDGTNEVVGQDAASYANHGGADIAAAWDLADGDGVTVAVLDTGLTHHPDIDTSLGDAGYDFVSDAFHSGRAADGRVAGGWDTGDWTTEQPWQSVCTDAFNLPQPSSWHGTHVAGTIAELTGNGEGMAGGAHAAKILPVRVLGHCGGYASDIADAIVWASGGHVDGVPDNPYPAQVINLSLGGEGTCSAADATGMAVASANSRGTVVVVAAGNDGSDAEDFTPASCPGVITVASVGITGKRAFYSNFGPSVKLAAPGGGVYANDAASGDFADAGFVWSATNMGTTAPDEGGYIYAGMAGTSQATPHVAATAALVISALQDAGLPALPPDGMAGLLARSARAFPMVPDRVIGAGIVDAKAAIEQAISGDDDGGDNGGDDNGGDNDDAFELTNGTVAAGLAGNAGTTRLFRIEVPAGARVLSVRSFGGSGDVSLYAAQDAGVSIDVHDKSSVHAGNNEAMTITRPAAGTWYVLLAGVSNYGGVSLQASFTMP